MLFKAALIAPTIWMNLNKNNPHLPQWVAIYMLIIINALLAGALYHAATKNQTNVNFPLVHKK